MGRPKVALLVVDLQNDFCPGGAVPVPNGDAVVAKVNRAVDVFLRRRLPIVASRDWHPRETRHFKPYGAWLPHCIQGTKGARFHPGFRLPKEATVVSKGMDPEEDSYSAFQAVTASGRDLESVLREHDVEELVIAGLATDYCVRASAIDGIKRGFRVRVLKDAVLGVDMKPGDSDAALRELEVYGVAFAETRELTRLLPAL